MTRADDRTAVARLGEDRLSAVLAAALVAANVAGGGLLLGLKALKLPPLVESPGAPEATAVDGRDPARPSSLDVARHGRMSGSGEPARRHR